MPCLYLESCRMCSVDGIELFFRNCLVRHVLGTRTFADGPPGLTSAGDRSQHPRMRVAGMVGSLELEMVLMTTVGLPLIRLVGLAEIKQGLNKMLVSSLSLEAASVGCPERVRVSREWALLPDLLLPAVRTSFCQSV